MQQDTAGRCPMRVPLPHAVGLRIGTGREVGARDCRAALLHRPWRPARNAAHVDSRHQQRSGYLVLRADPGVQAAREPFRLPGSI